MQPIINNPFQPAAKATPQAPAGTAVRAERESAVGSWSTDSREAARPALLHGPLLTPVAIEPPSVEARQAPLVASPVGGLHTAHGTLAVLDEPVAPPVRLPGAEAVPEGAHKLSGFARLGTGVALALTGLGILQGLAPTAAMAQTFQPSVTQTVTQTQARVQAPVLASNVQDVVNRFDATHQLYVVGHPQLNGQSLSAADMRHFQEVLKDHPSTYVVLVDATTNFKGDDMTLSRGIGNTQAFQGVTNPQTGERNGKLFMIYFNVDGNASNRKFAYRAEALPDRLGVGEANFADPNTGEPRELLRTFINAFRTEGKDVAGSLEAVMNRVDSVENEAVARTVGSADQAVKGAQSSLDGFTTQLRDFQSKHGRGGQLGSPDVDAWRARLTQAQAALARHDFNTATQLSNGLRETIQAQQQAMANYEQAPGIAADLQNQLKQIESQLGGLSNNGGAQSARQSYTAARQQLEQYETQYKAKDANFWGTLQQARQSTAESARDVKSSQDSTAAAHATKMYGSAAVLLAMLALGVISNRRAMAGKKKAELELKEAINDIGQRSKELLELMNKSDYAQVAGYQGKTKELADQLMANVTDALTLVGGARKFLDESDKLVNHGGVKSFFLRGNYDKAVDLLTNPETKLTFGFTDASREVLEKGSKAATWREQLEKAGTTREFQKSLKEVLTAMADNRDHATQILAEIDKKDSAINSYLDSIKKNGTDVQTQAQALQQSAPDKLFAVPSVTDNLLPMVLGDKDGLVAKGMETKNHDPVRAWDEFADPAKRMAAEAGQIVAVGVEARQTLIPTVAKGDEALQPNGVNTQWAHDATKNLSDRLDKTANTALRTSVAKEVEAVAKDVTSLETRIETAVTQDKERREVSPGLISDAENDVQTARAELTQKLQGAGAFASGNPDLVLRETDRDPSVRTTDAHANLDAVKPALDTGDVDTAGQHLNNIHDLTADAHRLVKETRDAFDAYPSTLSERQGRTTSIDASIGTVYQPSLDRIKKGYQEEVLRLVAPDVGAGDTLADNIDESRQNLDQARGYTTNAQSNFDKAWLLTSRDELTEADAVLKQAQTNLDAITSAESLLADKQQKVEGALRNLDGAFATTQGNVNQGFVRNHARQLLQDAQNELQAARQIVNGAPRNPYRADERLKVAENQRQQVEAAVEADRRAYNEAQSAIRNADGAVAAGSAAIASAATQSWSWSNGQGSAHESVGMGDLVGASATLATAASELSQARGMLSSQDYEGAERAAGNASSQANMAVMQAEAAVSSAHSRFQSQVSRLERLQQEEDDRRAAEERRQREAEEERRRQSESSSSGSSSGGWGGSSGGSGSTSGNW